MASIAIEVPASRPGRRPLDRATDASRLLGPVAGVVAAQLIWFPIPLSDYLVGIVFGLLGSLIALALGLVYRLNNVVNFAQVDLGTAPAVLAFGLVGLSSANYFVGLLTGLVSVVLLTAVVEMLVIRRFVRSPRLVLTVATVGLSQTILVLSLLIPRIWGNRLLADATVSFPWRFTFSVETFIFNSNYVVGTVVPLLALTAVAVWLRRSDVGVATRAVADGRDRAAMLGIPVNRLQTVTWVVAGVLSFLGVFLTGTIQGLPVDVTFSLQALVTALSALALGGFDSLVVVALSAVAVGVLQTAVSYDYPADPTLVLAVTAGVVLFAMVVRHATVRRSRDNSAQWSLASVARELPAPLRKLPMTGAGTVLGALGLVALVATLPVWMGPSDLFDVSTLLALVLVGLSIVVLTGWAGLVSLGQLSFAAAGAAASAVALLDWHMDLSLALLLAAACGAVVAVAVGIPALRFGGIFVAVTTLAFALAASAYFLDDAEFSWIPAGTLPTPVLFSAIRLSSEGSLVEFSLAVVVLGLVAVAGLRRGRTGRVLRALRTNERAAAGHGVRVTQAKLGAFAVSGAMAGVAGCLLLIGNDTYTEASQLMTPALGILVFTATAVGGLGAATGAVIGAALIEGSSVFLPPSWQPLPAGLGILLVLLAFPEGLSGPLFRARDRLVLWVAIRTRAIPLDVADALERTLTQRFAAAAAGQPPDPGDTVP